MYLAYNAPHAPLQATDKYLKRFPNIKDKKRKTYAAMVSAMDDGVGRVMNKLEALGLTENTIVFFLSDNGGPEKNNGSDNGVLRAGKGQLFEGGIHVPFAMQWPGKIPSGTIYESSIISFDIFATAIANSVKPIKTKNDLDGVDLIPYINGIKKTPPHDYLYWRKFDADNHALRNNKGDKIVMIKEKSMLFNLNTDISETNNLIHKQKEVFEHLEETYQNWNSQMLDPIFMGLLQDSKYSKSHPNRYKKLK